jgi:signal transduction histidine kinase
MAQSSNLLTTGQIKSISITLGVIFIVILLLFMSFWVGLIAMIPNLFPIIVSFGLMGWFGVDVSVATSLVACIAIGLAVDDTMHYLFRYNQEFKQDPDKNRALRDTLRKVGKPIVFTTLTIGLGFSVLIFSNFKPTAVFGILMAITMFSALLGDLILLPSLMLHVGLVTAWDLLKSMSTLDKMVSAIEHELNQPLNAIKMGGDYLKLMLEKGKKIPDDQLSEVVNEMSIQVDRASEFVKRIGDFNRRSSLDIEKVDVNKLINDVLAIMSHQITLDRIELRAKLDNAVSPVLGQTSRIKQMVFNLVTNAIEAMRDNQADFQKTEPSVLGISSYMDGNRVIIEVSDTGVGISNYEKKRIYEPFFTTKETGRGRGLGLSIVQEIVRDQGGRIQFSTQKGVGTTFKVSFPKAPC